MFGGKDKASVPIYAAVEAWGFLPELLGVVDAASKIKEELAQNDTVSITQPQAENLLTALKKLEGKI